MDVYYYYYYIPSLSPTEYSSTGASTWRRSAIMDSIWTTPWLVGDTYPLIPPTYCPPTLSSSLVYLNFHVGCRSALATSRYKKKSCVQASMHIYYLCIWERVSECVCVCVCVCVWFSSFLQPLIFHHSQSLLCLPHTKSSEGTFLCPFLEAARRLNNTLTLHTFLFTCTQSSSILLFLMNTVGTHSDSLYTGNAWRWWWWWWWWWHTHTHTHTHTKIK